MPVPKICTNCNWLEGKTYGGNLLVCAMHPYGAVEESCDDFQESDRVPEFHSTLTAAEESLVVSELSVEVKAMTRSFLREYYPYLSEQTFFLGLGTSSKRLAVHFVAGLSIVPSVGLYRAHADTQKSLTEWRSLKESGTLRAWMEAWLEEEISNLQMAGALPLPNSGSAIADEFWRDIRSALALCFPGSGEWSCRKVEREYLPDNLYEFETRSPSGELVRFNVSVNPGLPHELLLRELIGAIQQSSERTRAAGRYSFLFEDGLAETEDEEEWLCQRLHAVLRRCFPWSERWDIRKTLIHLSRDVEGEAFEFTEQSMHPVQIIASCHGRNKEEKLERLSRKIYEQSRQIRDRPQFRHLFEPPSDGRILPPATTARRTFYRPIPRTDRGCCDN